MSWRSRTVTAGLVAVGMFLGGAGLAAATEEPTEPPAVETEVVGNSAVRGWVRADGVGVGGVKVQAFKQGVLARSATTAADGSFALTTLVGGSYTLVADKVGVVRTQTSVTVPAGTTVRNVVITVTRAGLLTGKITNASGAPISATVTIRSFSTGQVAKTVTSGAATGIWRANDLAPGGYTVMVAKAGMATEWWNNSLVAALATPIAVAPGQTVNTVDVQLGPTTGFLAGSLSTSTNEPANGSVKVYRSANSSYIGAFPVINGAWATGPLAPGSYKVLFTAPGETGEWWVNADSIDEATPIAVGTTGIVGINAQLEQRVSVTGAITDPFGRPAPSNSLAVFYWPGSNRVAAVGVTNAQGVYTASGLRVGEYEFEARPPSGSPFGNSIRGWRMVAPGATPGGILDFAPGTGGIIVRVNEGIPPSTTAPTGTATLFRRANGQLQRVVSTTLQDGTALFGPVALGPEYIYRVNATLSTGQTVVQWSGEAATSADATAVQFAERYAGFKNEYVGETTSWLSLELKAPGHTDAVGNVAVYPSTGSVPLSWLYDQYANTPVLISIAPGTYKLRFVSSLSSVPSSWYLGALNQAGATPLTFVPGFATRVTWTVG